MFVIACIVIPGFELRAALRERPRLQAEPAALAPEPGTEALLGPVIASPCTGNHPTLVVIRTRGSDVLPLPFVNTAAALEITIRPLLELVIAVDNPIRP